MSGVCCECTRQFFTLTRLIHVHVGQLLTSLSRLKLQTDHVQEAQVEDVPWRVGELFRGPLAAVRVDPAASATLLAGEDPIVVAGDGLVHNVTISRREIELQLTWKWTTYYIPIISIDGFF